MSNYFEVPNNKYNKSKLLCFFAGPIQGAPKWHLKLAEDLKDLDINIASPCRTNGIEGNFDYNEQVDWETYYLNRADIIVFCIPKKAEDVDGRDYAQTTRFEIGEWLANSLHYQNKRIIVYMEDEVSGKRYIQKKVKDQYHCTWCETWEDIIFNTEKAVEELSKKNTFFTSDTHFSAQRTLELSKRPFRTVDEMDDAMINNWNNIVKPQDTVYHLGDFGNFEIRKHLNGKIIFIMGNYEEKDIREGRYTKKDLDEYFDEVHDDLTLKNNKYGDIYLCHEPMKCKENRMNLFGHIHGRQMIKKFGLDVGVDVHNFAPLSYDLVDFFLNALKEGYYDENVWRN